MPENCSESLEDECLLSSVARFEAVLLQNTVFVSSPYCLTAASSSAKDENSRPTARAGWGMIVPAVRGTGPWYAGPRPYIPGRLISISYAVPLPHPNDVK